MLLKTFGGFLFLRLILIEFPFFYFFAKFASTFAHFCEVTSGFGSVTTDSIKGILLLTIFHQRMQTHLPQNGHTWVTLSLTKPTSSISSLLGSIGGKRRKFWMKGKSCLPEGTIGSGKASSFTKSSCDSGSSMSLSSSIVKPNKLFNPIVFYSICEFENATPVGEDVGATVGEDVGDAVGEDARDAVSEDVGDAVGEDLGDTVGKDVGAHFDDAKELNSEW